MIPIVSVIMAILFPLLSLTLYFIMIKSAVQNGIPEEVIERFRLVTSAMAFLGILTSITMLVAHRTMVRHIYKMEIICTVSEIIQRFPDKEIRIFWSQIKKISKITLGRLQQFTIIDNNGNKIKIDATFIEMTKPLPELKMTWRGEALKYEDGSTKQLTLKENDLYAMIKAKANC
ncbi:MAG: hypothetical protein HQK63_11095 [Desulfamplus sp.]|nr:hypothetical protein [Desulfamplus sp.]